MSQPTSSHHHFIITGLLVIFSLGFLGFFTESDSLSPVFQNFIVSVVFFLVIPLLYSKIVLKESLKNIGWQKGNVAAGIFTSILSVVLACAAVIGLATAFPDFREQYVFPVLVETSFFWFMLYELVLVTTTVLLYEVFFRGLIQTLWLQKWGIWAVIIQSAFFFALLYLSQNISWEMAPLLIFCPLAGLIAYRAQSIWYSFAASWTFLFLTDVFFLIFH